MHEEVESVPGDVPESDSRRYVRTARLEAFSDGVFAIAITFARARPGDRSVRECPPPGSRGLAVLPGLPRKFPHDRSRMARPQRDH
jgi:hypothetical protein